MAEIRLGKIHLRWCDTCNLPVLEQKSCGRCGSGTRGLQITPPGDARPAFEFDIRYIREIVDRQFGPGTGDALIPSGKVVVLNKAPDLDRMDEIILDGEVAGAVRFDIVHGNRFLLKPLSAKILAPLISKSWVIVDDGALDPIRNRKASTLAVGVLQCDPGIRPGDDVLVLDKGRRPVSVGVAKMSAEEMLRPGAKGTAVKTRWVVANEAHEPRDTDVTWDDVLIANSEVLERRVSEAKAFISRVVSDNPLPIAVSYSGGKDSLATLLLVLEAGIRPKLMFIDTGLEFQETRKNVEEVAEEYSLEIVKEEAGDAFWRNVSLFGPPAKDYRWCCKTCKLGPATRIIQKNFPKGVLSFIGQRAYESELRAGKGRIWRNPWTPNQLGASPIQKWTALHVWIYLFSRKANYNPLYRQGLERIGCFLCPATDLAELKKVREMSEEYERWDALLDEYSKSKGMPDAWREYDLWRWRRVPESILNELSMKGIDLRANEPAQDGDTLLEFRSTKGYSPCVEGLSMEGVFTKRLDMGRVANLLNAIGTVTTSPDGEIAEVRGLTVFGEGPVMIRGKTEEELDRRASITKEIVFKAMNCTGCGICIGRCESGAIHLEGRATIDAEKCTHCSNCLGPCPVVAFREEELDI
ncbi:MAG: phosphoadenosine phosphosulfate reductase family protein [Thermoplasmata archaeon]|nr:phosphoadenosine phosphosulfate reductase family protein [Thermoplasmata archaeon]